MIGSMLVSGCLQSPAPENGGKDPIIHRVSAIQGGARFSPVSGCLDVGYGCYICVF